MRVGWVVLALALVPMSGCFGEDPDASMNDPFEVEGTLPQESTERPAETPSPPAVPTGDGITNVTSSVIDPTPAPETAPTPAPAAPEPAAPPPAPPASEPTPPAPPTSEPTPPPPPPPSPSTPSPTPQPTPTPPPPSWPREGSHVSYRVTTRESYPGTEGGGKDTTVTASWTYRDDDWHGVCDGESVETLFGNTTTTPIHVTFEASDPPHWPLFNTRTPGPVGSTVASWLIKGACEIMEREARYEGTSGADHVATDFDTGEPDAYRTSWDRDTGLVKTWDWQQRYTHTVGDLTSTDAP